LGEEEEEEGAVCSGVSLAISAASVGSMLAAKPLMLVVYE
jgi:hypothetical protein